MTKKKDAIEVATEVKSHYWCNGVFDISGEIPGLPDGMNARKWCPFLKSIIKYDLVICNCPYSCNNHRNGEDTNIFFIKESRYFNCPKQQINGLKRITLELATITTILPEKVIKMGDSIVTFFIEQTIKNRDPHDLINNYFIDDIKTNPQ
ncbi:MAG: hypothetical protein GF317_09750 [Candidatus Lokiarchaeota archaeon]|nr:hypothetical protein [Candidatus Lokiarchaeota archaeon]